MATIVAEPAVRERIGPYVLEKELGRGAFGLVYLAHDEQLQRLKSYVEGKALSP